ncbi:transcription factor PAR1 [Sesamum indicum]|uniref:Transcription factor PAR1 n=1 Tax=Sesamum indicum TaxID=4182 RepID=A0A6I9SV61_SESIN|nr:transcription factor PAR1 [Sesamum indicum]
MGCNRGKQMKRLRRRSDQEMGRPSVRMRVKKLQKLIPGGQGLNPDRLLLRTADYILLLRLQIDVLQTLSQLSDSLMTD